MDRRDFLQKAGVGALAFSFPGIPNFAYFKETKMGVVVHSYGKRWNSKVESKDYPGFMNAIDMLEHCHKIGAGGIQVGVKGWDADFVKKLRKKNEKPGLYIEGSIGLPKSTEDVGIFEQEIKNAKDAGVVVMRAVCLGGRRYEDFKTKESFQEFKKQSIASIERAEPVVRKHKVKLAIENHKDWRSYELVEILKKIDSEWVGATIDFGNNISLLEEPMEVVNNLAPYVFSTHVKDMGVQEYEDGFLLSEVPLGKGIVDLPEIVSICKQHNPAVTFNLEMITRDPLKIPCLTEEYWATFDDISGQELAKILRMVRQQSSNLPTISQLNPEGVLAMEEDNILASFFYTKEKLSFR